ncbi:hypothetical protein FOMPIDRAFT_53811 [Fomitopsis schrenkii]|uniref:Uncharacterized protein n=1 Tax=Fomitopsis schrenkii TaxID=2126942 RepID=S8EGN1_FOMSC|nr:hypothetical protein FOMPIDRAFT_53811 [Fomitopsis schrenkii]
MNPLRWRELPDGHQRRLEEYKTAWSRCLARMQGIVRAIHAPLAARIAQEVKSSYIDQLPGLPHPELPVVALSAELGSPIYADVVSQLETAQDTDSELSTNGNTTRYASATHTLQIHLHPADCPNLLTMMRAIVVGFTSQLATNEKKNRSAASLANYDIARLEAWYRTSDERPTLAVFLHDFEQFEVSVAQDAFYICSLHVPRVPLVFVLGLTSPSTPTYLHKAYSRSTLALLRVCTFSAPPASSIVDQVITKTFFDPSFDPVIMIGPATLDFLHDFTSRHTASLDALYTILQLAHMKHFTEPLTALAGADAADIDLASDAARPFADALAARLQLPSGTDLLDTVDAARDGFRRRANRLRVGLAVAEIVRKATETKGDGELLHFASAVLRGRAEKDVEHLGLAVKELPEEQLRELVEELTPLLARTEDDGSESTDETPQSRLEALRAQLPQNQTNEDGEVALRADAAQEFPVAGLANEIGDWIAELLEQCFARLDEGPLWDIWYMGNTPFPADLINPAPRLSVVSALMHPDDFLAGADVDLDLTLRYPGDEDECAPALWQLPDASILFRRYADAGRMVNVFDWFQSFAVVLEGQRRHLRRCEREAGDPAANGGKPGANGAGVQDAVRKGKQRDDRVGEDSEDGSRTDQDEDGEAGQDSEEWREEVQARFMRALHTLDHMGLVRHTGRKADHIVRTVYDVLD